MNPNNYYPQAWSAAQMTGYQPADPAAPASISAGSTGGSVHQEVQENPEAAYVEELARILNWKPEWVKALIELRLTRDRQSRSDVAMPFDQILDTMKEDFGEGIPLTTASLNFGWKQIREKLPLNWGKHKRSLSNTRRLMQAEGSQGAAQPSHGGGQEPRPNFDSGSVGAPQSAYGEPYQAHQPAYGVSYGGSQSGYGGQHAAPQPGSHSAPYGGYQPGHHQQYGAPQPGPSAPGSRSHVGNDGWYGAPQPGFGDPYQNVQLPPIAPGAQPPRNQGPPPVEPPYQVPGQNYNNAASQAMTPAMQEPLTWYLTGRGGSSSQAAYGGDVSEQEEFGQEYHFAPR